jgi:serine palmitoyltransferase
MYYTVNAEFRKNVWELISARMEEVSLSWWSALDGESLFLVYIVIVVVGALFLCYLDEKKSSNPTVSAAVFPLWYPDESIPWNKMNRIDFLLDTKVFGLSRFIPSSVRRLFTSDMASSKSADEIHVAYSTRVHAYSGFLMLAVLGFLREAFWTISLKRNAHHKEAWNSVWWKEFFTQHMYRRIEECWGRPISGAPSSDVRVCIRSRPGSGSFLSQLWNGFRPLQLTGEERTCINMASYNYLGFGGIDKDCTPACVEAVRKHGVSFGTTRSFLNGGSSPLHLELEKEVARFVGKEDAIVMGMGFATNSSIIPAVVCGEKAGLLGAKSTLILSDELNHKSIVEGCRLSGASIKSFKHSDMKNLESILETETRSGKWEKIFIFVEGVY